MTGYSVTVPPRVVAGMRRHAAATVPAECCGALIGSTARDRVDVRALIPLENASAEADRYLIEAGTVRRLERRAACAGLHVVGFYHSHPQGAARPSALDLELASPGYLYVIVGPASGSIRGWRLRAERDGFDELRLSLLAGAA